MRCKECGSQELQKDTAELVQPQQLVEVVAELRPEERERMTEARNILERQALHIVKHLHVVMLIYIVILYPFFLSLSLYMIQ